MQTTYAFHIISQLGAILAFFLGSQRPASARTMECFWLWFLLKSPSARKTFGDHLAATTTNTPEEAKICLQQAAKAWEQLPKECRNWG
jgi:hypothetical protein